MKLHVKSGRKKCANTTNSVLPFFISAIQNLPQYNINLISTVLSLYFCFHKTMIINNCYTKSELSIVNTHKISNYNYLSGIQSSQSSRSSWSSKSSSSSSLGCSSWFAWRAAHSLLFMINRSTLATRTPHGGFTPIILWKLSLPEVATRNVHLLHSKENQFLGVNWTNFSVLHVTGAMIKLHRSSCTGSMTLKKLHSFSSR